MEAATLEEALGLERGSLSEGFRISTVADIDAMQLVFPVDVKNPRFLGAGKGLPGGGTEIIMSPSLPVNSPFIIEQVIVEVVP